VTRFAIRYAPGTDLARRWPAPTLTTWATREEAEDKRRPCINSEHMEIVEVGE